MNFKNETDTAFAWSSRDKVQKSTLISKVYGRNITMCLHVESCVKRLEGFLLKEVDDNHPEITHR